MDHAFRTRAPQAGPPPSSDWSLIKTSSSEPLSRLAQYHVLDAVGVRLGAVTGWVTSPQGVVAGLCVGVRGFFKEQQYLIPLGYVTQINPRHGVLHLRDLTRRMLAQATVQFEDSLPPDEVLEAAFAEAPTVRPEILSMLQKPELGPVFSHTPRPEPARATPPRAPRTEAEAPRPPSLPPWRSLAELAADEDLPYWL